LNLLKKSKCLSLLLEELNIDRKNVFNSTYQNLKSFTPINLVQTEITVSFIGENGIDGGFFTYFPINFYYIYLIGGLKREWITLLGSEIFNSDRGLFTLSSNQLMIQPSPFSFIVPNHLILFKFIGNLIGKVIISGYLKKN